MAEISKQPVTLIRVYTDDSHGHINKMLSQLHERGDVMGATIFRGIAGFGDHGIHQSNLLELTSNLPVVIELFHKAEKSDELMNFIHEQIENAHIISWQVNLSFEQLDS